MCLSPVYMSNLSSAVPCRSCWVCRNDRVDDLVGRCLAEQATCSGALAVTLTYAGDVPEAATLRYSDFQNFMKRLRKAGYSVRFIVAGEYGSAKERAHWHAVLFFQGKVPDVRLEWRFNWEYWPHGWSYFQRAEYDGFRYLLKYALKQQVSETSVYKLGMSKKPPLGHDFFMESAHILAAQRLPLNFATYSFANVRTKDGKHREFWLRGRMREMYIERYEQVWQDLHDDLPPWGDHYIKYLADPRARDEMEAEKFGAAVQAIEDPAPLPDPDACVGMLLLPARDYRGSITAHQGRFALLDWRGETWRIGLTKGGKSVEQQLRHKGLPGSIPRQVCQWLAAKWQCPLADLSGS